MSKQIKRQVLIKGQTVEALFAKDGFGDFLCRVGNARFSIVGPGGYGTTKKWCAGSFNDLSLFAYGATPFKAYCNFVRKFLHTNPKTGKAVAK